MHLDETAQSLLDHLILKSKSKDGLQSLDDPNEIIDRFPSELLNMEGDERPTVSRIANALNILFNNSGGTLSQCMQKLVQEIHRPPVVGLDGVKAAKVIARYVAELGKLGVCLVASVIPSTGTRFVRMLRTTNARRDCGAIEQVAVLE